MKIRTGFVSNSSTSSFVIVGFLLPKKEWTHERVFNALYPDQEFDEDSWYETFDNDEEGRAYQDDGDGGAPKGKVIVGYKVAEYSSEDCDFTEANVDLAEMTDRCNALGEQLGVPKGQGVRLFCGTEAC
jgi:hypothetical protein